jgi:hypothetical protein
LSEIDDTANQESRDEQVVEDLLASLCCPDESEKYQLVAVSHQLVLKTAVGVFVVVETYEAQEEQSCYRP